MKKGSGTCDSLASGRPLSILHMQGRYVPGETAEQWRGEGSCEVRPLDDILDILPTYTQVAMISSKRIELEKGKNIDALHEGVSEVCLLIFQNSERRFALNMTNDVLSPNLIKETPCYAKQEPHYRNSTKNTVGIGKRRNSSSGERRFHSST